MPPAMAAIRCIRSLVFMRLDPVPPKNSPQRTYGVLLARHSPVVDAERRADFKRQSVRLRSRSSAPLFGSLGAAVDQPQNLGRRLRNIGAGAEDGSDTGLGQHLVILRRNDAARHDQDVLGLGCPQGG